MLALANISSDPKTIAQPWFFLCRAQFVPKFESSTWLTCLLILLHNPKSKLPVNAYIKNEKPVEMMGSIVKRLNVSVQAERKTKAGGKYVTKESSAQDTIYSLSARAINLKLGSEESVNRRSLGNPRRHGSSTRARQLHLRRFDSLSTTFSPL